MRETERERESERERKQQFSHTPEDKFDLYTCNILNFLVCEHFLYTLITKLRKIETKDEEC